MKTLVHILTLLCCWMLCSNTACAASLYAQTAYVERLVNENIEQQQCTVIINKNQEVRFKWDEKTLFQNKDENVTPDVFFQAARSALQGKKGALDVVFVFISLNNQRVLVNASVALPPVM